ncbi:hypothetical protein [Shewanella sp. MEBiC00475]|uniref:hypothetical protein n=1 Tax=Shewanella sp. MEBiC00475 TaxID=2575361 RepID=UPI0010BFE342|nr:hypothetical protein [Shewanella sp. MEBiC00475]
MDNKVFNPKNKAFDQDIIPDFIRISSSADCCVNCFRTRKHDNISWVEYAFPYPTLNGITYRWQPIPPTLNTLFQQFISKQNYGVKWLSKTEKGLLIELLDQTWTLPSDLEGAPSLRKDSFFRYMTNCVRVDNELSTSAKSVLLPKNKLHHRSAAAYQQEDSERITYKIFWAQERYIIRLFEQIRHDKLQTMFPIHIPTSAYKQEKNRQNTSRANLINETLGKSIPREFKEGGRISQSRLILHEGGNDTKIDQKIYIGSNRNIAEHEVSSFFKALAAEVLKEKPTNAATLQRHIAYFNLCTCHLTLLFILLTSTRPTHAISIERAKCFGQKHAFVSDKGKLRKIILSNFLTLQLNHYLELQKSLSIRLPPMLLSKYLWHLYDENGLPKLLSAKYLRRFMHARFHGKVPYMLRHVFAQCALTSIEPVQLTVSQIDRLMGHSEFGEHLGSDHLFPANLIPLEKHLNSLSKRFGLSEICYV